MGKVRSRESSPEVWRLGDRVEEEEVVDEDEELRSHLRNVPEETIREIIRYRDTLHEFGPYKIDFRPDFPMIGGVCPVIPEKYPSYYPSYYERAMISLRFAIDHNNSQKASNLELHKVVRLNMQPCTATHYYLTFEAKDKVSGQIDVYCSKVWDHVVEKEIIVEEFFKEKDGKDATEGVGSSKTYYTVH